MSTDFDCPDCNGPMRWRDGRFGRFMGCAAYPDCTGTRREDGTANGSGKRRASVVPSMNVAPAPVEEAPELEAVETPPPEPLPDPEPGPEVDLMAIPLRPEWLQLDEHQEAVVQWREGKALVAAGAGAGKSAVLIERIASLLADGALPEYICTLVYNTAAAKDFKARLIERVGAPIAGRTVMMTFHGFCFMILKRWDPRNPAYRTDRIIGTDDGPSGYMIAASVTKRLGFPGEVQPYMQASEQIREALVDLQSPTAAEQIVKLRVSGHSPTIAERLLLFTKEYQAEKRSRSALDFADMIYTVGLAIRQGKAERLRTYYQHVQVDEGQDINVARLEIARHLSTDAMSLVVVGDLRQSVYGFNGARPDLFKGLLAAGAQLMSLPVNRRSTRAIVDAGNRIAEGKDWNLGGACSPVETRGEGEPIRIALEADTPSAESSMVAAEIAARVAGGLPLADESGKASYACLVRTNAQAAGLEAALTNRQIPVRVLGSSGGVWMTSLGREMRAYLAAAENQLANDDILKIANKPVRFLKGDLTRDALTWARKGTVTFVQALRSIARQKMEWKPERHGAWQFADDLDILASATWSERCHAVAQFLCMDLLQRSQKDAASEVAGQVAKPDEDKEAMYKALATVAARLGSLEVIEAQIKTLKKEEDGPAVEISTMHRSKGKEWPVVFVCGVAEGLLPHKKAEDIEEECRLFYVACTRAKDALIVSPGSDEPSPLLVALRGGVVDPPFKAALASPEHHTDEAEEAAEDELLVRAERMHPPPLEGCLRSLRGKIQDVLPAAEAAAGCDVPLGVRFVQVTAEAMENLLHPLGFWEAPRNVSKQANQRVFEMGMPGRGKGYDLLVRLYSTIPVGEAAARGLGDDSIRFAALRWNMDDEQTPLHKKLPHVCRTKGWRATVLHKLLEILDIIESREGLKEKEN